MSKERLIKALACAALAGGDGQPMLDVVLKANAETKTMAGSNKRGV